MGVPVAARLPPYSTPASSDLMQNGDVTTAFVTFALAGALVVLIPGPDTMVVLRSAVLSGRRTAALTSLGVLTGLE